MRLGRLKSDSKICVNEGFLTDPYLVSVDVIDTSKYDDITSAENWEIHHSSFGKDYKWFRSRLQEIGMVDDTTWTSLSTIERKIICKHKSTSPFSRVRSILTNDELNSSMRLFDENSKKAREIRFGFAKTLLINNISQIDQYMILSIINNDKLDSNYISQGIEGIYGINPDPIEALFNFVLGSTVSDYGGPTTDALGQPLGKYSTSGVAKRSITMLPNSPYTQSTLVITMMDCLVNGNYT